MCLTNIPARAVSAALSLLLCAAALGAPVRPAFAPDCEPRPAAVLVRFTLEIDGKSRVSRDQAIPAETSVLVVAGERGIDSRLEITDPAVPGARTVDSPMRRWGPQRLWIDAGRARTLQLAVIGKERARGAADITMFAIARTSAAAESVCIEAQHRLAAGDAHYASGQRITLGEASAPPGTAKHEYEAAVRDYAEAARLLRTRKQGRTRAQAELSETAALYQGSQRYPEALASGTRAERTFVAIGDAYGIDRARAMRATAQMEVALDTPSGSYTPEEAQQRTARLLSEARALLSSAAENHARRGESFEQALALNNVGLAHYYEQRFDDALESYQKALAIQERLGERNRQAQVLQNMALVQYEVGRFADARASYQRALPVIDRKENPRLFADVLNNLALSEQKSGQPDIALRHYSQALDMLTALQATREQARSLHGIGATYYDIGNRAEALSYFARALDIRKAEFDPYGRLASLRAIADVYRDSGDIPKALAQREEALALAPTPASRAMLLIDLARDAAQGGLYDTAAKYFDEIFANDAAGDPVLFARALFERASFRFATNSLDAASSDAKEAQQLFRAQELSASIFSSLLLESRIACARGDTVASADAADQAMAMSESLRRASSNPTLRAALWQPLRPAFDQRIRLLAQEKPCGQAARADPAAALEIAERARGRALEDFRRMAAARKPGGTRPDELRRAALFEDLASRRSQIEALSESSIENGPRLQVLRNEVAQLARAIDILDAEIGARSQPGIRAHRVAATGAEMIRPGAAVVEYWLGEKSAFAWLVTREHTRMFDLGPTNRISIAARAFHESLRDFSAISSGERRRRGRELSALIVSPMLAELGRARAISFVPDGELHAVPFAALVLASGPKEQYLIETHDVSVVPALRSLEADRPGRGNEGTVRVLIVADPVYDRGDPRFAVNVRTASTSNLDNAVPTLRGAAQRGANGGWQTLPGSRREAEGIAALFPSGSVRMLTGFEASRENLLDLDLQGFRILHFASHAVADSEAPQLSALILSTWTPDGRPSSGEIFAGDLLMRRLDADLVVLSACDTALGRASAGEGLLGLRYAAHAGGARTVVASLWPVADNVGEFIMTRMYSAVATDHREPVAALSQAMREARARWDDPALWAVFQASSASIAATLH